MAYAVLVVLCQAKFYRWLLEVSSGAGLEGGKEIAKEICELECQVLVSTTSVQGVYCILYQGAEGRNSSWPHTNNGLTIFFFLSDSIPCSWIENHGRA